MLAVKDALEVLEGRWKLPVIFALTFGNKRFMEISREIDGITDKMLSKALKELEMNQLIERKIYDTLSKRNLFLIRMNLFTNEVILLNFFT